MLNRNRLVAVLVLAVLALSAPYVMALANPTSKVTAFQFTATTTQAELQSGNEYNWKSCRLWNNSATQLYVGGIEDTLSSTVGWKLCTDTANCPEDKLTIDGRGIVLEAASGTLTVHAICTR